MVKRTRAVDDESDSDFSVKSEDSDHNDTDIAEYANEPHEGNGTGQRDIDDYHRMEFPVTLKIKPDVYSSIYSENNESSHKEQVNYSDSNGAAREDSSSETRFTENNNTVGRRRGRPRRLEYPRDSDKEYTESDSEDSESATGNDNTEEFSDGGFVVDSDDNLIPKNSSQNRRRQRSLRRQKLRNRHELQQKRRRLRKQRQASMNSSDENSDDSINVSDTSIAEELRELNDSQGRQKKERHFRNRAPVDYSIPAPPTVEEIARTFSDRQKKTTAKDQSLRRLFDVRGPFGGKDVVTLFKPKKEQLEYLSKLKVDLPPNSGKSNTNTADIDPIVIDDDVDFSVVGGLDNYISKLKEMISLPLLYPELYEKFGITPPRGVLFHGPPGTGKTLMARALAASHKEEKVTFYMRKGADVLSKWIGESERQLRALFDEARANQPSIIFFDEIDGLAPVRSAKQEQHHASIVSTLLSLMDGMDNRGQVVVIGATNRPDSVDPALRRPGRFDREFYFPLPDKEARKSILKIHTRKWNPPLNPKFLDEIASQTRGFGGADLRALTTEAALLAIQHFYPQIYNSKDKLIVDPNEIEVRPQDFSLAMERIQPSSSRPSDNEQIFADSLPSRIEPLLRDSHERALEKVHRSLPALGLAADTQASVLLDGNQFQQARDVSKFNLGRVHRPRLLLKGETGNGQSYLAKAIAHSLEGVYVVEFSAASLTSSNLPPETSIVNKITEAKRRMPSCILFPDVNEWTGAALTSLIVGLFKSFLPSDQLLILGAMDVDQESNELVEYFGEETLDVRLNTSKEVLDEFFEPVFAFIKRPPTECLSAVEIPKKEPKKLEKAPVKDISKDDSIAATSGDNIRTGHVGVFSEQERVELRVRSQLKLKLGVILDGFRQKYRRFRKPVIDEQNLVYLFENQEKGLKTTNSTSNQDNNELPTSLSEQTTEVSDNLSVVRTTESADDKIIENNVLEQENINTDSHEQYVRTPDDMILDTADEKRYYNMDLETIEDRLWNGYYCEASQFLDDVEKIYKDSLETNDRERLHKAAEMLANAQVAVDDISADKEFAQACRALRVKDAQERLKDFQDEDSRQVVPEDDKLGSEDDNMMEVDGTGTQDHVTIPIVPPVSFDVPINDLRDDSQALNNETKAISTNDSPIPEAEAKSFICDEYKVADLRNEIQDKTIDCSLEELQLLLATCSNVAWNHRMDWDRSDMISAIKSVISRK